MKVKLAYGRNGLVVDLPDDRTTVIEPVYVPGLPDEAGALTSAMRNPLGTLPLRRMVSAEQTVVDEQTRRQLAALGYLSATAAPVDEDNAEVPSPREKIAVHNRLLDVFSLFQAAEYEEAEGLLLELLADDDEANGEGAEGNNRSTLEGVVCMPVE